jgi:hypothetical protein
MAPSLDVRSLDVPGLDSVDDPPTANKLPMVTNSLSSNSLNEKSLQLSVLQDATALTMEARAAALAQIEASIASLRQMHTIADAHYQCINWNMSAR